jgi:signal transduction histidine kinase
MAELTLEILDSLSSGVLAVDRENRILFVNRSLARSLKIKGEEWVGRPAFELGKQMSAMMTSAESFDAQLEWQAKGDEPHWRDLEWKEGENVFYIREKSQPLRDTSGKVVGRLFAYHDISRDKVIDLMKTEFIAIASHELRTPMTSIKGSIDLILSGFAGEISAETQELLEIAQNSCDRLIRLINGILDLAKIEAGQIKLHPVPLNMAEVAERSIRSVKSLADRSEVTLKLEQPTELPPVEADKDRIEQVVTNLLSNAIKFSPPRGEVRVELKLENGWLKCSVIDQGCGIPPEDLERVFGKFQQVGDTRRKGGTGLGLAITQALILEHKGRIWVESKLNEGSQFIFVLPAQT